MTVSAFPLQHKLPCYGFRFDEVVSEKHLFYNPSYKGKSYAYCSDTKPFKELPSWVAGVDTLYHEATYMNGMEDKALQYFHSTTAQAALCAKEAGAGRLIVGHYSSRIRDYEAYLHECAVIFPNTVAANDLDVFKI